MQSLIRSYLALLLLLFSASLAAQTKSYTVTAPDGVRLAVQEAGDPKGPPIIFIHGLLGSRLNWERQFSAPQLQRFRLIAFDLRGHGFSDKPAQESAYRDGRRWGADLAAVIAASHAHRPLLVGWSLGGAVITNYLAIRGDRDIRGAIYVGGVVEMTPSQIPAHPRVYQDMIAADLKTHLDGERAFLHLCFHQQPDNATFERLQALAALAAWPMQRAVPGMSIPLEQGLGRARVPLLFVYGAEDALVRPEPSLARARQANPAIQSRIYPHAGHAPFIEQAARFNRELAAFAARP